MRFGRCRRRPKRSHFFEDALDTFRNLDAPTNKTGLPTCLLVQLDIFGAVSMGISTSAILVFAASVFAYIAMAVDAFSK